MSVQLQNVIIAVLVACATAYVVAAIWRALVSRKSNCCGSKGCERMIEAARKLDQASMSKRGTKR